LTGRRPQAHPSFQVPVWATGTGGAVYGRLGIGIGKIGDPLALPGNLYDNLIFDGTVMTEDFFFVALRVQVSVGDTVKWQNNGALVHTATDLKGNFDMGDIAPGQSKSITFDTPGTFDYNCSPHPWMIGQVIVQ
jgi:hypothetical protein